MDEINTHQQATAGTEKAAIQPDQAVEVDVEDDAVRKVEEATTPSKDAQQGVQNVEAVTLTWTKTSLALAFAWYVSSRSSLLLLTMC